MKADKGNATVVVDRAEYRRKISEILSDSTIYKKLRSNPIESWENKFQKKLTRMKKNDLITEEIFNSIRALVPHTLKHMDNPRFTSKEIRTV